jgi:hypothetical protein
VLFLAASSSWAALAAAAVCSRSSRPSWSWSGSMNGSAVHLRAAAEPPALQLPDQEPQLLDLGLRRLTLLPNEVALGQNSTAFGLQRDERGILLGDDFGHLLQMVQQSIGIAWKITQHQRHGAILLTASRES